jgi:hypothetical protein
MSDIEAKYNLNAEQAGELVKELQESDEVQRLSAIDRQKRAAMTAAWRDYRQALAESNTATEEHNKAVEAVATSLAARIRRRKPATPPQR